MDRQIAAAMKRGREAEKLEPRANAVRFDEVGRQLVIELTSGATVLIPIAKVQGLSNATAASLRNVELSGRGYGLHWPDLDVDYSVPGLIAGRFGTAAHMSRRA